MVMSLPVKGGVLPLNWLHMPLYCSDRTSRGRRSQRSSRRPQVKVLHLKKGKGGNNEGTCTCALCARSEVSHTIFILHMCIDVQCTYTCVSLHVHVHVCVCAHVHILLYMYVQQQKW